LSFIDIAMRVIYLFGTKIVNKGI
jgi:hypothetical protein